MPKDWDFGILAFSVRSIKTVHLKRDGSSQGVKLQEENESTRDIRGP